MVLSKHNVGNKSLKLGMSCPKCVIPGTTGINVFSCGFTIK